MEESHRASRHPTRRLVQNASTPNELFRAPKLPEPTPQPSTFRILSSRSVSFSWASRNRCRSAPSRAWDGSPIVNRLAAVQAGCRDLTVQLNELLGIVLVRMDRMQPDTKPARFVHPTKGPHRGSDQGIASRSAGA